MAGLPTLQVVAGVTVLGGVVGAVLAAVAVRHRDVPAAVPFGWLSLAAGGLAFFESALLLVDDATTATAIHVLGLIPGYQIPALWLVFTIVYVGRGAWLTPRRIGAIWAPLLAVLGVTLTAPVHGWTELDVVFRTVGGVTAPVPPRGGVSVVGYLVSFAYILAGYGFLSRFLVDSENVYRRQTLAIVAGSLFPVLVAVFDAAGLTVHPGVSFVPVGYVLFGTVIAWALFRAEFLRVAPVASETLVQDLPEPILVLDGTGVVRDHNPTATRLTTHDDLTGRPVDDVVADFDDRIGRGGQITLNVPGEQRPARYDVRVTDIEDQFDAVRGRLVLFRDVSTQHRRLEQLEAMQAATQQFIGARTTPEVAEIAVRFAGDVFSDSRAVLYLSDDDDGTLEVCTATDDLDGSSEGGGERATVSSDRLRDAYDSGETVTVGPDEELETGFDRTLGSVAIAVALGDHGVVAVGTDDPSGFTSAEERLVQILARTTETALTRVDHELELRESRAAVDRRNNQIEFFNGVLRHNIRNSMMVIDGQAEFLASHVDGQGDKLATIRRWCRDMTQLTEKIRAINHTLTESEGERLAPVDLTALLRDQNAWLAEAYDDIEVSVSVHDGIQVTANDLVEDVVESVVRNAVEHNDAEAPRVSISTRVIDEWIQVRIADNGPGLSEEMKTQVFQRDIATSQTAHGFGLYFVSVMMDLYAGNVWFEDADERVESDGESVGPGIEERGTTVVLEFPLVEGSELLPAEH